MGTENCSSKREEDFHASISGSASSASIYKHRSMVRRIITAVAFIFAMIAPSWGQQPTPIPGNTGKPVHWRKYVNKEYGISLWYPGVYRPTSSDEICMDNEYRRYLLCLERPHDPEASILVTIVIAQPFHIYPHHGDVMPTRQKIGHHVFYCGLEGSMGTGFSDQCILNLRGRTLEFSFSPAVTVNTSNKTNPLGTKILRTFRIL